MLISKQQLLIILSIMSLLVLTFIKAEAGQYTGRWEGTTSQGLPIALTVSNEDVITQIDFDHKVTLNGACTSTYSFNGSGFDIKINSDGSFSTENSDGSFNEEDTITFNLGGEHSEGIMGAFRGLFTDSAGSGSWTGYWYRLICGSYLHLGYAFFLAENDYFFTFNISPAQIIHEHCDRDHLYLCNTEEICSSAGLHWCAGQCQQDPCPVVPPTPHIQANGSDGPITIPTEGDMSLSVALDCGSMSGLDADWWLVAQTPSGWYYFDVAQGTWMPGTSFLIWQGPLFSFSNVELPGFASLPEGSSTFYFGIDTNMNGLLDADLYYDSVVVQMMQESLPSQPETFTNSLGMTFNLIPAGTFMMGSPENELGRGSDETQHQVTLTRSFYMQTTEVAQAQWEAVMGNNPSYFSECGGNCPVEQVSWNDVQDFITALNSRGEGNYRLPTEAEWEYAARAGSTTAFANGDITDTVCNDPNPDVMGWYCGNNDPYGTKPVAHKLPNAWGLYDMHGNVWEWVQDCYGSYPTTAVTDPTSSETGWARVRRGGSWVSYAQSCRSAARGHHGPPDFRLSSIGFRLLRQP
jgi:formylglycine-generating enzyme required for sulfatase activity